ELVAFDHTLDLGVLPVALQGVAVETLDETQFGALSLAGGQRAQVLDFGPIDRLVVLPDAKALVDRRQEGAAVVLCPADPGGRGDGDESGEVLVLRAEAVE